MLINQDKTVDLIMKHLVKFVTDNEDLVSNKDHLQFTLQEQMDAIDLKYESFTQIEEETLSILLKDESIDKLPGLQGHEGMIL